MGLFEWLRWLLGPAPQRPVRSRSPLPTPQPHGAIPPSSVLRPGAPIDEVDPQLAALKLERFAPISADELAQAAQRLSLRNDPWLGRVDTIPPAEDPRTGLIDRALVSEGYFTPEELAHIHEIGDRYREIVGDVSEIARAGREAVAADEGERRRRKEEKRAAAQARREAHRLDVARRRATDLIHLGRGVSAGLADRRANVERLESGGLPVLATPADCAHFLEVAIPRLRWLAWHSEASTTSHYIAFTVPKKSGGLRQLAAPKQALAACQQKILRGILDRVPLHETAHGFVPGRDVRSNAEPHVGAAVLVNLDLADFFPSISFVRIRGIFAGLGYSPAVATILALLCSECPRQQMVLAGTPFQVASGPRVLPQGACTSPALANICARRLDARLAGLARAWGWRYTRYADDLSFSNAAADADVGRLLTAVRSIVTAEGFAENAAKTRVLRAHQRQEVTGLVVNQRAHPPRPLRRRLRAILHRARREGLEAQNREGHPHFVAWLRGMIDWIGVSDRELAGDLRRQLLEIDGGR